MDDLAGKTVLLLGYGSIAQAVEARLRPFGVEIVRVAKHARAGVHGPQELADLLPLADVLVVLAPHTAETDKLLGMELFAKLKPGALLVNASRGKVIDTQALLRGLLEGRLQACLDVTDPEPLPDGHPLWTAPGVFITPHLAGWSPRQLDRAYAFVRDQVRRHLANEPLVNVVAEGY
jgi:phosphoglycerate dehydrogenase-like enzyme